MNAIVSIPRDAFGILSSKNTVSKYWGVSLTKNKKNFTVRFQEKVNKEIVTFKPLDDISEQLCARIAARFFDEPNLYSESTVLGMVFPEGSVTVNTCTNTIKLDTPSVEDIKCVAPVVVEQIEEAEPPKPEKKQRAPKVVDHFRNRVNEIILEALNNAKAKLAAEAAAYF